MGGIRNYLIVTASYWSFTLTDGALRMLVLLHFYALGYTPFMLASLFLLYETAGIFANLGGGWLATRFGIPRMLAIGLVLQIAGLLMLSVLDPGWGAALSVAWAVIAQGISGVAKDVTKTASKSAIKATSEGGNGQLFKWVAWFTGSKNAMKGFGFFAGGLLLETVGFRPALWLMAAMLAAVLVNVLLSLPRELGKAKASKSFGELFAKSRAINLLAAARIFLFGSRDVWFVVGLPVFLYAQRLEIHGSRRLHRRLDDRLRLGAGHRAAGFAPQRRRPVARNPRGAPMGRDPDGDPGCARAACLRCAAAAEPGLAGSGGLSVFGFAFAVISSLHSYLILAYAGIEEGGGGCRFLLRGECRAGACSAS